MSLFAELKRRNVIRMAGIYLVGAWLIAQVSETLLPIFDTPAWVLKTLVALLALGFVPALVFSWVYELTPGGLKRDAEVPAEQSIAAQTGRRMNRLIVIGLLAVVALVVADRYWPRAAEPEVTSVTSRPNTNTRTIAVLPFVNLSADPEQEFFSDGITEEILNVLAGIEGFTVTSRTSSFHFKGKDKPLPEIARELGVDYVLEGSVRKAGQQVRIAAQLIKVDGDAHLWSESWTRDMADIFAVQEGIARNVASELKARLSERDEARLAQSPTRNVEAYEQFLRGQQFWNQRSIASLQAAVEAFKAALAADPDYTDAWAGLAQTYALIPEYTAFASAERRVVDTIALAHEAADRALKLDPSSSRALSARAYVRVMYAFDWEGAEADYRATIASDPRDAGTRHWYGELLAYQRRWKESAAQYDAALALDPLAPIIHYSFGLALLFEGDSARALPNFEEGLRLLPGLNYAVHFKILAMIGLRRFDEAIAAARDLPDNDRVMMESIIAAVQDPSRSDEAVRQVMAHGRNTIPGRPLMLAVVGRHDLALAELEHLFALHDPLRVYLYCVTAFDPLHQEPRFQALLRQIGLPASVDGKAANGQ
jgi:TolB-like protein/Tfp pilus assembly protein PilF